MTTKKRKRSSRKPPKQVWGRWPCETDKSFKAFGIYLTLPEHLRTIANAYRIYTGRMTVDELPRRNATSEERPLGESTNVSPAYFRAWAQGKRGLKSASSRPKWTTRVIAHESFIHSERLRVIEEEQRARAVDYLDTVVILGRSTMQCALKSYELSNELLEKISKKLDAGDFDDEITLQAVPAYLHASAKAAASAVDVMSEALGIRRVLEELADLDEIA